MAGYSDSDSLNDPTVSGATRRDMVDGRKKNQGEFARPTETIAAGRLDAAQPMTTYYEQLRKLSADLLAYSRFITTYKRFLTGTTIKQDPSAENFQIRKGLMLKQFEGEVEQKVQTAIAEHREKKTASPDRLPTEMREVEQSLRQLLRNLKTLQEWSADHSDIPPQFHPADLIARLQQWQDWTDSFTG